MLFALDPTATSAWPVPNWSILVPIVTGFLAVWYLLPTPRKRPIGVGLVLILLALGGVSFFFRMGFGKAFPVTIESIVFGGFSTVAVLFGILMITSRNPARSAIYFAVVVLAVCGLFLLLAAPFLMAATIIIYAGAIIVTFLFVLMLSQQSGYNDANDRTREPFLSAAVGFLVLASLFVGLQRVYDLSEVDSIIDRADRFAEANFVDEVLLKETSRTAFLDEAQKALDRLTTNAANPQATIDVEKNPVDLVSEAIGYLRELGFELGNPPSISKPMTEVPGVRFACRQLRDGLAYLKAIREGKATVTPPITLSPYGQAKVVRPSSAPTENQLPTGNVAALGRVLFTDHLISIEIGGTLLLVATIGAILIASGRREKTV